jgi:hypothetical protein
LDFDRTLNKFHINSMFLEINEGVVEVCEKLTLRGYRIVLNTYRADLGALEVPLKFIEENGIVIYDVLSNKLQPQTFRVNTEVIFLDDEAPNIPLKSSDKELGVMIVDFEKIEQMLT